MLDRNPPTAAPASKMIVVQLWATKSPSDQLAWLHTMRDHIGALNTQEGFETMITHASNDGHFIAVYATWSSAGAAERAISSETAKRGHAALMAWGTPQSGGIFRVVDVFEPAAPGIAKK